MALVGLMQTLALEGARNNIRVNCIAPTAATQMLDGLLPQAEMERLHPAQVSPAIVALVGDDAPTRAILCAGAGSFEAAHITLTQGVHIGNGPDVPESIADSWSTIIDREGEFVPESGERQGRLELAKAGYTRDSGEAN
jgi:NAD(P)-dependent dehydrogenase (short-subunit alcohol dehydrogenase family)